MIQFDNSYAKLPEQFFSPTKAQFFAKPKLIQFNQDLANELDLNLEQLEHDQITQIFSGQGFNTNLQPIAIAYAGHQFGYFNPQLGDGRAFLVGEVLTKQNKRFDIVLKGAGPTPFSRNGDGKSALGPVIREYILCEAMYKLGVPTTRALAAVSTGENVIREKELPGGIFTRVASSHIRIGTFEYFAGKQDSNSLKILADYSIKRHYSYLLENSSEKNIYLRFLEEVAKKQSLMVSKWMSFGFIHGVMNTDNMLISGETIDYGPCAFMDNFSSSKVFSSIDRNGRYAYGNQIEIGKWNLYKFASTLLPLIDEDNGKAMEQTQRTLDSILPIYDQDWTHAMGLKLGIFEPTKDDVSLINQFLDILEMNELDFTLSFRNFALNDNFDKKFKIGWLERLKKQDENFEKSIELMNSVNPLFIPRNHQVEAAIQGALKEDYTLFKEMNLAYQNPFIRQDQYNHLTLAPLDSQRIKATFCGT